MVNGHIRGIEIKEKDLPSARSQKKERKENPAQDRAAHESRTFITLLGESDAFTKIRLW